MKNPTFMGLSLGGMTGLGVALSHPKRLKKLVCCDARADAPPAFIQGWDDRIKVVREKGLAAIASGTSSAGFRPTSERTILRRSPRSRR